MQPKVYICWQPEKQGTVFGLFYSESGVDVTGWHIEARNGYFSAGFFLFEDFYTDRPVRLYRSLEDDAYGQWVVDSPPLHEPMRKPVLDEVAHELERLQSMFVEEWLFFDGDTSPPHGVRTEYERLHLPVHAVNVRPHRFNRFARTGDLFIYAQSGMDLHVVQLLRKYWRLSEKVPAP